MKALAAVIAFFVALGIAGTDDFEQAQIAHKTLCEQLPQQDFCKDEIK